MFIKIFSIFILLFGVKAYTAAQAIEKANIGISKPAAQDDDIIDLSDFESSGKGGALTKVDVKTFFMRNGSVNAKLKGAGCIKVDALTHPDGRYKKSLTADQIFFISGEARCLPAEPGRVPDVNKLLLVLKNYSGDVGTQSKVEKEIKQLQILKKEFKSLGFSPNMPRIIFSEFFYKYPNLNRTSQDSPDYRYMSLIHPAKGENLWSLVEAYTREENQETKEELRTDLFRACARLGEVLANFHLKFMDGKGCPYRSRAKRLHDKTPEHASKCATKIHGDLHFKNIFWDNRTNTISFIDIATLEDSPHEMNWLEELSYTFGTIVGFSSPLFKDDPVSQLKRKVFIVSLYKEFLTSYLAVVRSKRDGESYRQLTKKLNQWTVGFVRMRGVSQEDIVFDAWVEIAKDLNLA